jgi:T1SS-143 domain-containing protein
MAVFAKGWRGDDPLICYQVRVYAMRYHCNQRRREVIPTEGEARVFDSPSNVPGEGVVVGSTQTPVAAALEAIGKIRTAIGSVTIMRADDVVVQMRVGDFVYRHDTIETGPDGAVGITFTDGTAFNLSNNARMVLNQFVCDGTSNSALFSLSKGAFSFIAGKVAKTRGLRIDTPFARIRGAAQDGGIGILTLAALAFSTLREIQAASRSDAFLGDGTITYKDSPHGTFEITTRDGRVIVADDPGETIVVDPAGSVTRIPNSSSRMAELQQAQQDTLSTLSLGLGQQGAAPGGSSTHTFNTPLQFQPINFNQLHNDAPAPLPVTINVTANQGAIEIPVFKPAPPPVMPPNPVLAADSGAHAITEIPHTTGSGNLDTASSGVLTFTDFNVSAVSTSVSLITWSGGATPPSELAAVLAGALSTTINGAGSDSGSIALIFSAADNHFDFLAAGQTLDITYNVTATDNNGLSLTQPVTITVTGTNDAPVLAAAGLNTITKHVHTTGSTSPDTGSGTLTFADVDLADTHKASTSAPTFAWLGGALTAAQQAALAAASTLTLSETDSTGSGAGSIAFSYSAADKTFDFLAVGQTLTITYLVTVTDNSGVSSTQPVTITINRTNDAPAITSGATAVRVSEEGLTNGVADTLPASLDTTNSTSASGTITATDVDGDALTMSLGTPSASLTSGGVAIAWTLQDAHTLVGKAGATTIITATISDAGAYNVTLSGPIDHSTANQEDNKTFIVPVTVSDGHTTTPTTLSVTIEDDSPKAEPVEVSVVPINSKTNVMLILDLSGSMDSISGLTGLTRLDVEKAAVNELLDRYDNRGDVMVRIVTFSDTGSAVGNVWMSVADAKAAIAALSAGGATNYDAALLTAMAAFTDGTKLTGPGTQNVTYFLSDGDPTTNSDWPQILGTQLADGIQANEQAVWESFLTSNNIVSFALGIPNVGTPANLNPIAFDPASGTQLADTPIIVTDLGQLANTLVFTIPPVTGSVLTGADGAISNSFGADGGFVQSITVNGVTYTFNPAANGGAGGITTSGGGGSFIYDGTTKTLAVDTDTSVGGGEFAMVMTTGAFTFQLPTAFSSESVGFVLVDRDGDTANSMIHFSAASGSDHPPIVRDDRVVRNDDIGRILPAGVAGSPMSLGLTNPADDAGPVTAAIAGVPSGWSLSEGANNGGGSWTIQANNVSMLSITSPANHAGAIALQVTMSWTNPDGSSGFARVIDNVEVFAPGAPIFAWSGEDRLTGSSGKDLFVFAQPIGHDTIYSFNTSQDQIDLIGYAGFASFDNAKEHLAADANGNAVITLADGQSITLFGVPTSSLSANNFVFDQTPALSNTGTLTIDDGALLPLSGIITNSGTIVLDSTGNETHLELIQNGIALQGGGQIILSDSDENLVSGTIASVTLTNVDNTMSGAGQLGGGRMTLINSGTITAIGTHALVIDTGPNIVGNAGTLEATGSGGLIVNSDVANSGLIWANGGNVIINGSVTGSGSAMISGTTTLEFGAASTANITFAADAAATLILRDTTDFTGTISGLSSTDHLDLANISCATASVNSIAYSLSTNITTLVITDGTNTDTIGLLGNYSVNTAWHLSDDGHGGTIVSAPQVSATNEDTLVRSTAADSGLVVSSPPLSATREDTSVPSTLAGNNLVVKSPFTEVSGNGDHSAFLFKASLEHHTITDPQINFAQSGNHGPAALGLAKTFDFPGTVTAHAVSEQAGSSDKFMFGQNLVRKTITDFKSDMTEIDHTMLADIQHLLDIVRDMDAMSTLDSHHSGTLQDTTKVPLLHHLGDFHFA